MGTKRQENAVHCSKRQEAGCSFGENALVITLSNVEAKIEFESSGSAHGVVYVGNRKRALDG